MNEDDDLDAILYYMISATTLANSYLNYLYVERKENAVHAGEFESYDVISYAIQRQVVNS